MTIVVNEWKNLDIGTVPVAGSGSVSQGMVTVNGSGPNIWKNVDDFHFMFRPVKDGCSIAVRMLSHPFLYWGSKAGVMMGQSLGRDSSHAYIGMEPGGVRSLYMAHVQGLDWAEAAYVDSITVPYWLKLVRNQNTITTFLSSDGQIWTQIYTKTYPSLASTLYVGFAVASGTSDPLTVTFDNVTVTQGQ